MSDVKRRGDDGPAILSDGFPPFFLAGAFWAGVAVMVWLRRYFGELTLPNAFQPTAWHGHEVIFGYGGAVVAGFLLTSVPNWAGRPPLRGKPLLALFALWLAGRLAVGFSAVIGWAPAALADCAFLVVLCAAVARDMIAGKNWRDLRVLIVVALLAAANFGFHIEACISGDAAYGRRFAVAVPVALIMLIGGRITPSFTHTFLLQRRGACWLPEKFGRFDAIGMAASAAALLGWVIALQNKAVGLAPIVEALAP